MPTGNIPDAGQSGENHHDQSDEADQADVENLRHGAICLHLDIIDIPHFRENLQFLPALVNRHSDVY